MIEALQEEISGRIETGNAGQRELRNAGQYRVESEGRCERSRSSFDQGDALVVEFTLHILGQVSLPATGHAFLWCVSGGRITKATVSPEMATLGAGLWRRCW